MKPLFSLIILSFFLVGPLHAEIAPKEQGKSRFEQLELFNKVLYLIETQYYRKVDSEKLIQGAIKGMMDTLDPHSAFLGRDVYERMQRDTSGEFGGLGIEVTEKEGTIYIITPIDDTPAFRAGVKPGDKIVEINYESTAGFTLEDAVEKMRGKPGSSVTLGLAREGEDEVIKVELKREKIQIKPIKYSLVEDNFAFVRLTQFSRRSAKEIASAIQKMDKQAKKSGGIKGIILDLRSNPGGLLDEAVNVSSLFLKEGVVVSTEVRDPTKKEIRYVKKSGYKNTETPIVVLINGASASASEIVAGALQDHGRAVLMGSRSFGKGSVQTVAKIDKENGVKLTIAQYMTPSNRKIQAVGIKPDIELDEVDAAWIEKNKKEARYIREKDLRNHLVATIETDEEKKLRLKKEKEERIARVKALREKREAEKKKKDDLFKKYDPQTDYQVVQAVNFLRGFAVMNQKLK